MASALALCGTLRYGYPVMGTQPLAKLLRYPLRIVYTTVYTDGIAPTALCGKVLFSMTPDEIASFEWLSPANYHTRCTDRVTIQVASEILLGATWQSATKKYGVRHFALKWFKWGFEAAQHDAGPDDTHAIYLNWYLKLSQAIGFVEAVAQQRTFREAPRYWLENNPEAASDWTTAVGGLSVIEQAGNQTSEEAAVTQAPVDPRAPTIRTVLRMLIEAGAAVKLPDDATTTTVDADTPRDGTGTHG